MPGHPVIIGFSLTARDVMWCVFDQSQLHISDRVCWWVFVFYPQELESEEEALQTSIERIINMNSDTPEVHELQVLITNSRVRLSLLERK